MSEDKLRLWATWAAKPEPQARDVAKLRLRVNDVMMTSVSDFARKEDRDFIRGSAVSLAFWFADNFWRLRYESLPDDHAPSTNWRLRHDMTSAAGGTVWPPIMIHSTGDRVLFGPAFARPVDVGALRFAIAPIKTVDGETFVKAVDGFFEEVIATCALAVDGKVLEELVEQIRAEYLEPDQALWRRLEARLGYDPDTVPQEVMLSFADLEGSVGDEALAEAAAAAPGRLAGVTLKRALEAAEASDIVVDLQVAREIGADELRSRPDVPAWERGREAAKRVRAKEGFGDEPIRGKAFADLLRVTGESLNGRGTAGRLPYAARLRDRGERQKIALRSDYPRDRRFELSCALGDEIWTQANFGVISRAKTDRQKFQRAFAQNLLVPYDGLKQRIDFENPTERQLKQAAVHYHVHENVIRRLLILERVLPPETFEQRLEAA